MNRLVLFDVDGTLISTSQLKNHVFSEAIKRVYGVDVDVPVINHQGMVDTQIIYTLLEKSGIEIAQAEPKIEECRSVIKEIWNRDFAQFKFKLLPGVLEVIEALSEKGVLMGLVTGNLESIAMDIMREIGLHKYLNFGGFGEDGTDRVELVRKALAEAGKRGFVPGLAYVIGDTPKDVECGRRTGIKTIAVATGKFSEEELFECDPNYVFKDLSDTNTVVNTVLEG